MFIEIINNVHKVTTIVCIDILKLFFYYNNILKINIYNEY